MSRKRKRRRKSPKMAQWVKRAVHKRDKVCQNCSTRGSGKNPLTVHHKKPRFKYPELVNDPNNCIILCTFCHRNVHKPGGDL